MGCGKIDWEKVTQYFGELQKKRPLLIVKNQIGSVKILGRRFVIIRTNDLPSGLEGTIDWQKGVIQLHTLCRSPVETLYHEIVHGIDIAFNIGLTEEQVERLGSGLRFVQLQGINLFKRGEGEPKP